MHLKAGGFWCGWHLDSYPIIYLRTPWWHVLIGRWEDRLFSERYGFVWCKRIGKYRLTIRNLRRKSDA